MADENYTRRKSIRRDANLRLTQGPEPIRSNSAPQTFQGPNGSFRKSMRNLIGSPS